MILCDVALATRIFEHEEMHRKKQAEIKRDKALATDVAFNYALLGCLAPNFDDVGTGSKSPSQ